MDICDLLVIGGGSGGVRAARIAAGHGAKVIVVEKGKLGGTCVNVGCVPKKLFSYCARFNEEYALARGYGWDVPTPRLNWAKFIELKNAEIARLNGFYQGSMERHQIAVVKGHGKLLGGGKVSVGEQKYQAKYILIATGGISQALKVPNADLINNSDDIFYLESLPRKLLVLGGGYIALEFASIFRDFGVEVDLAYRGELFLKSFDIKLRQKLLDEFKLRGIQYLPNTELKAIDKVGDQKRVVFSDGAVRDYDFVLGALGRVANLAGLGIENTRIQRDKKGNIVVGQDQETAEPGVYAVGDVCSPIALTPVAIREGHHLADLLFAKDPMDLKLAKRVNYGLVPTAIFTNPSLGVVGMTTEQAIQSGHELDVYETSYSPMKSAFAGSKTKCFLKLIADKASREVLGVHLMGVDAPEMVQGFAVAMRLKVKMEDVWETVGIHPTVAEDIFTLRN